MKISIYVLFLFLFMSCQLSQKANLEGAKKEYSAESIAKLKKPFLVHQDKLKLVRDIYQRNIPGIKNRSKFYDSKDLFPPEKVRTISCYFYNLIYKETYAYDYLKDHHGNRLKGISSVFQFRNTYSFEQILRKLKDTEILQRYSDYFLDSGRVFIPGFSESKWASCPGTLSYYLAVDFRSRPTLPSGVRKKEAIKSISKRKFEKLIAVEKEEEQQGFSLLDLLLSVKTKRTMGTGFLIRPDVLVVNKDVISYGQTGKFLEIKEIEQSFAQIKYRRPNYSYTCHQFHDVCLVRLFKIQNEENEIFRKRKGEEFDPLDISEVPFKKVRRNSSKTDPSKKYMIGAFPSVIPEARMYPGGIQFVTTGFGRYYSSSDLQQDLQRKGLLHDGFILPPENYFKNGKSFVTFAPAFFGSNGGPVIDPSNDELIGVAYGTNYDLLMTSPNFYGYLVVVEWSEIVEMLKDLPRHPVIYQ